MITYTEDGIILAQNESFELLPLDRPEEWAICIVDRIISITYLTNKCDKCSIWEIIKIRDVCMDFCEKRITSKDIKMADRCIPDNVQVMYDFFVGLNKIS